VRAFHRLGVFVHRFRWGILLLWGVLLLASVFFAPELSGQLKGGGFEGSNSEAERVQDLMSEEFGISPATLIVVFDGDDLSARGEEFRSEQERALAGVREMPEVRYVSTYADTQDPRFISEDGKKAYAVIAFNVSLDETRNVVDEVRSKVRSEDLQTYVTGAPAVYQDLEEASNEDIKQAEKYAFPFALLILVLAFGTVVAAGVPVLIGGVSVLTTLAALYFVAGSYDMSVFVLTLSTMLGLGLGIDYALFFVSRFREELESYPVSEAIPRAVATAGRSIFFSGTAVLIGLSGLLFFPFMFMRSIGVAGVMVVFVSVAAALTLLPALLGVLGHRVNWLPVRRRRRAPGTDFWSRSAEVVMRRPVVVILLVAAVLAALLYPVTHMKVGIPEASVLPEKYESRAGDDILKKQFDYSALNPMQIVATLPEDPLSAAGLAQIKELGDRVPGTGEISRVESVYTVGEEAARDYAERVAKARKDAEMEADRQVEKAVARQLDALRIQYGFVPPGAEGRIRAETERSVARELESRVPKLPEGVSADGEITPRGVSNFLELPEARESEELQDAISSYVAGNRTLLQGVTEANPYT
jgi:putative drug exporter of the RND superfamily